MPIFLGMGCPLQFADFIPAIGSIGYGRTTITRAAALRATQYLSHERIPFGKPSNFR
jgi:hypothetical protein